MSTVPSAPDGGIQKINLKLFLDVPAGIDWDFLLAVFGRWRLEPGEEIIDLADYGHVERGPGCLLLSHRWHFGIDRTAGAPGLFWSARKGLEGPLADRLLEALRGLIEKSRRLLAEPEAPAGLRPRAGDLEIVINDRVRAVPGSAAEGELERGVRAALDRLYGPGYSLVAADAGGRVAWRVRAPSADAPGLDALAARIL